MKYGFVRPFLRSFLPNVRIVAIGLDSKWLLLRGFLDVERLLEAARKTSSQRFVTVQVSITQDDLKGH